MDIGIHLDDLTESLENLFSAMTLAEEEITAAQQRHPDSTGQIWNSFLLLVPSLPGLTANEQVYRSHCRELLDRVKRAELHWMQHCAAGPKGRRRW